MVLPLLLTYDARVKVKEDGNWRSFRHRNFRILFAASGLSNIGTWAQYVAQDWLILELTHSGTYLGIVSGLQFAPYIFFSLHGGALADKLNKRAVLIWTNLGAGTTTALLGWLVITDQVRISYICLLAFLLGTINAFDGPVRLSFTAEVVGEADISNAVSINSFSFNVGRLVGPALSGWLIAIFGTGPSFIINAISYIAVLIGLMAMDQKLFFLNKRASKMGNIREGLRYVMSRPDLFSIMIAVFFMSTFGMNTQIFNALFATKIFGKGPAEYGILGTFVALGALAGTLLAGRVERFTSASFIIRAIALYGISVIVLALTPDYLLYSVWLPLCGLTSLAAIVAANSFIQVKSDPAIRGRVMGIYLLVFMGGSPFGSTLIGFVSEELGVRQAVVGCGVITLIPAIVMGIIFRRRLTSPVDITVEGVLKSTKNY